MGNTADRKVIAYVATYQTLKLNSNNFRVSIPK